ncbi:ATP-binding protein, partial [Candidatus Auribacterota bacterium]
QNSIQALQGIVSIPKIEISAKTTAKQDIEIKIADNGCGIPVENQTKIFTPGFTTRNNSIGFGLGICRKLVRSYGGDIILQESTVSQETIFLTKFPLN